MPYIELLGRKFIYWVKLEIRDADNFFYEDGASIEFMEDDSLVIRNTPVNLRITYLWWRQERWIINDDTRNNDLHSHDHWKHVASKGWMKPYFAEFLKQWPKWEEELLPQAIDNTLRQLDSQLTYTQQRLDRAKKELEGISLVLPFKEIQRKLHDYHQAEKEI